jgi:hydrogen peroxide-dependent heme synthase
MTLPDSAAPLTLEGHFLLHQMFRVRWTEWKKLLQDRRAAVAAEAAFLLEQMEKNEAGPSCSVAVLGHKCDLMLIHFRLDLQALHQAEQAVAGLGLGEFLEPAGSYVSVVELGLYDMTLKIHAELAEKGIQPATGEHERALAEELSRQRERMKGRLVPAFPKRRYVCFYPMSKKRGEVKNWYAEGIRRRGEMMREHGLIGRRYAEQVTQIISGSIGFDDWEWGVDLFADDPLVFKKLVYEMRFDEASAWYGEFGPFLTGLQFSAAGLAGLLSGETPPLQA